MPAKLASPVKVEYARLDLDDLLSRLEDPQGFFDRSPILLTACRDRLFLGDGDGGLQVAKQLKIAKVRARIEHYESEDEAYLAAVDASYIINSARGLPDPVPQLDREIHGSLQDLLIAGTVWPEELIHRRRDLEHRPLTPYAGLADYFHGLGDYPGEGQGPKLVHVFRKVVRRYRCSAPG